jgi:hypothetical protein
VVKSRVGGRARCKIPEGQAGGARRWSRSSESVAASIAVQAIPIAPSEQGRRSGSSGECSSELRMMVDGAVRPLNVEMI